MDDRFLTLVIISVMVSATLVRVLVARMYDPSKKYVGYQKRNILHADRNAELRILSGVLRQDDALATIKLLDNCNPTKESPLLICVLHLVELVGLSTPLIIDHQLGQKASSHSSATGLRVQHIIDAFSYFKHQNLGAVSVQVFTAVSPHLFMHDDVCSLAFDKLASLVILPFHRKWSTKGKMVLDDSTLRIINCQVLDKAPCSVGILVDRRKVSTSSAASIPSTGSTYHVAMLFLGGEDDREALALVQRMAKCPQVYLTVVQLVPADNECDDGWERMLDAEILKDVKRESSQNSNVVYRQERVKEGADTALMIRSMESNFELIVVGRRHRADARLISGLAEWSEFPELGPIGDLLASSDIQSTVSALVVQQQQLQCD